MTAAQIEAALWSVPRAERFALAAELFALAFAHYDDLDSEPQPELAPDRESLVSHLHAKRSARR